MNKHELKSLLENIYHLLAEEGEFDIPSDIPLDRNGRPIPYLWSDRPQLPPTPLVDPETPIWWTPEMEQYLRDRIRLSTPGGWLGEYGFPPEGVPALPAGFPSGAQEWYQGLTPEQRQLILDWVDQHFGMLELFNHREFFEDVLRGKHTREELLRWLKENWPELYQP